jgi:hypothetical protein
MATIKNREAFFPRGEVMNLLYMSSEYSMLKKISQYIISTKCLVATFLWIEPTSTISI